MEQEEIEDIKLMIKILLISSDESELIVSMKKLNAYCAKGSPFQNLIADESAILETLTRRMNEKDCDLKLRTFQLIANLCVQNKSVQEVVWNKTGERILEELKSNNQKYVNIAAMIIHNMILNETKIVSTLSILETSLEQTFNLNPLPDFLHILLDHIILTDEEIIKHYNSLDDEHKKKFLIYIHDFVQNDEAE